MTEFNKYCNDCGKTLASYELGNDKCEDCTSEEQRMVGYYGIDSKACRVCGKGVYTVLDAPICGDCYHANKEKEEMNPTVTLTPEMLARLEFAVIGNSNKGNKINAIKALRSLTNMGLKDAKDFIEAYQTERNKAEEYTQLLAYRYTMHQKLIAMGQDNPELAPWANRLINEMDRIA